MLRVPPGTGTAHVVEFGPVGVEDRVPQILQGVDNPNRQMSEGGAEREQGGVLPMRGALISRQLGRGRYVERHWGLHFIIGLGNWLPALFAGVRAAFDARVLHGSFFTRATNLHTGAY